MYNSYTFVIIEVNAMGLWHSAEEKLTKCQVSSELGSTLPPPQIDVEN